MTEHNFKIILDRRPTDSELDRLFEVGCDDAAFGTDRGLPFADFDREAKTITAAIVSAVRDLESIGFLPLRVVNEDILTLADLAQRIGQSRESVRRYATGERGPGAFPPPINPGRDGTSFYRWSEVAPWFQDLGLDIDGPDPVLAMADLVLQGRRLRGRVTDPQSLYDLLTI